MTLPGLWPPVGYPAVSTPQRAFTLPSASGSATTDTAAITAAVASAAAAGGGVVQLQAAPASAPYRLASMLSCPDSVTIVGMGGGFGSPATVVLCTAAGAGINVSGGGGVFGAFRIDGATTANLPFTRSGGLHGSGRTFIDLGVWNAAQDNAQFIGAQNDAWINCNFAGAGRDNGYFDQGYGGALFLRCEFVGAGRYHHNFDVLIGGGVYTKPSDIQFVGGICEGAAGTSVVRVTSAFNIRYQGMDFYTSNSLAGDLIDVVAGLDISFGDPWIINGNGGAPVAGSSGIRSRGTSNVIVYGAAKFQNLASCYLVDGPSSFIQPLANVSQYSVTAVTAVVNGGTAAQVATYSASALNYNPTNGTDIVQGNYTAARTALRYSLTSAGTIRWYPGTNFTADVSVSRQAVGVAGVTPGTSQGWATGAGTTAQRPAAAVAGTSFMDQTLGLLVTYTGTNWVNGAGAVV